jgi:Dolichyl-phosphate-mannose-protein mannosyltransferase
MNSIRFQKPHFLSNGRDRPHQVVLLIVWLAGGLYGWHYLDRGWWPNNAGAFALGAERVLDGELPHRDFDEIYTGGANYLHALAFKVFGTSLAGMRRALFIVFLIWIPAVYYIATRFTTPVTAGLVSLLAVTWSLPIYSEPIASWYNLFLATHGAASLLRYLETERRRWLFAAGVCGGLSLLAKIIGVYFLIAACLSLLFYEQSRPGKQSVKNHRPTDAPVFFSILYRAALIIGVSGGVALLWRVVLAANGPSGVVHFAVPIAGLVAVLIHGELTQPGSSPISRLREQWRMLLPIMIGVLLAVGPFLMPYVFSGSLAALTHGLFVSPIRRFAVTANPPPVLSLAALPAILILGRTWRWPLTLAYALSAGLIFPAAFLVWHGASTPYYPAVVSTIRAIVPTSVLAGCLLLMFGRRNPQGFTGHEPAGLLIPGGDRPGPAVQNNGKARMVFTVMAVAALCSLVQFPVAETIYIYFVAPLGILALLAVFSCQSRTANLPFVVAIVFYLVFTIVWINRSIHLGVPYPPYVRDDQTERLNIDRAGGIRVRAAEKEQYEALVRLLPALCSGKHIFATPDCSEVYFLSGFKNPTRITYDFFDDPAGRTTRIKEILARKRVDLVVLNRRPQYSGPPSPELVGYLRQEYPQEVVVGSFEVRWR